MKRIILIALSLLAIVGFANAETKAPIRGTQNITGDLYLGGTLYNDALDAEQAAALALKADVASPTFTGTATIPTADINGGTIDSTTIGALSIEHTVYVDGNRTDTYTADGGVSRPYKTVKAAIDAINTDATAHAAAGHYELSTYIVKIAPGTYSDNLTFNNEKYLRLEGAGVELSGAIAITQTQQTGDYYSRLEFVGIEGYRAEKGPAFKISGGITATRNNDSLTYITFKGCYVTGAQLYDGDGTWVVYAEGSKIAGTIDTGTFADADSAVLLEASNRSSFSAAITDKVSLYNVDNSEFTAAVTITPVFDCRVTNTKFSSTVSIIAAKNLSVDTVSLKSIIDRTPTLTDMTIVYLDQVANGTYKGIIDTAAPGAIGGTTPAAGTFTTVTATTVNGTTFDTNVAAAGVTLTATTLSADGTDENINIAITPKGTGEVDLTKVDIDAGAIDGTAIGANSASTGVFTTLSASTIVIPEKTPVNAVASSKLLTIGTAPVEGETVSIGGVTYKFRAAIGAGAAASKVITSTNTDVADGDTVTIGAIVYRFKDTMAAAYDVKRDGTTADTTLENLIKAINGTGTEGVEYFAGTSAHASVSAGALGTHEFTVTAKSVGFAGNAIALDESSTQLSWAGAATFLSGGIDAQAANDVLIGTIEESIDNLVLAVTAGANEGTKYGTGTVVNPYATAVKASAATMTATNLIKGVIGDSTAIAETLADGSWAADATFLSGGVNATVCVANEIVADASFLYHCIATGTIADTNWRKVSLGTAY